MQAGKTFRIFVSSTFSDLKEERNALQQHVFPKLRELCQQHGCRFQAIDLRWGVRDEATLDQQTMKICLGEIERCQQVTPRPNFIVLLGDRYGWRPLPREIPAVEFTEIEQRLSNANDKSLLDRWYRRDDNAVPAVYCLQPRDKEFKEWDEVEAQLRSILLQATAGMTLTPNERLKYTASATEQEIAHGALRVPDAHDHVFCFFRKIRTKNNLPLVEDLPPGESAKDFVDLVKVGGGYQLDAEARRLLEELKNDKLRPHLRGNIYDDYEAEWVGTGITTDHISKLCDDVLQSLSRVILEEIEQLKDVGPLKKEIKDHESFSKERAKFFTGRVGILQAISDYVQGTDPHPLAIYGDSGSGKTALLAQAMADCESRNAECVIVSRFIGATPASSDGRTLLESLCRQISRCYGADEASVPAEYQKLVEELQQRLALATADKPLIVFIDALDQLSDFEHAHNLIWLRRDLPAHVRLIVSTLPGECLTQLERKPPAANLVKLEPMPKDEGGELLNKWLTEVGRTLQDNQRAEVLGQFAAKGLPLYLKLAFEESRRWKSYDPQMRLGTDIPGIVPELFRRLSADHGQMLVSRGLGYLAAAKNGLTEDELLDVLALDEEFFEDFKNHAHHDLPETGTEQRRLPVVVWSRLYFDLEAYLTERSADGANLLAFFHRQFGEVVAAEDYLAGDEKPERHRRLADYFEGLPMGPRKIDELPWHLEKSGNLERLKACVTGPAFLLKLLARSEIDATRYFRALRTRYDDEDLGNAYATALEASESMGSPNQELAYHYLITGRFLEMQGYLTTAEQFMKRALSIDEELLGPNHVNVARDATSLALLFQRTNREAEAEPLLHRVLRVVTETVNPNPADIASALQNLGLHYSGSGRYTEAENYYRRALETAHTALNPNNPGLPPILFNLAGCLHAVNRSVDAEPLERQALSIGEQVFGPSHPHIALYLNQLATTLRTRRPGEAEQLAQRAKQIYIDTFGENDVRLADPLTTIAHIYQFTYRLPEAEKLLRQALELVTNQESPHDARVAFSLENLAEVVRMQGRLEEAASLFRQSIQYWTSVYNAHHFKTQNAKERLEGIEKQLKKNRRRFWV